MVRLRVSEQPDGTFAVATPEAIATYVDRSGYVVLPVQRGLEDAAWAGTVGPSVGRLPRPHGCRRRQLPRPELTPAAAGPATPGGAAVVPRRPTR